MSFSFDVKSELSRVGLSRKCCAVAEAYGILLYCNTFRWGEIRIVTEHEGFGRRLPALFKKAFHVSFDQLPQPSQPEREGEEKKNFVITDPMKLQTISEAFGQDRQGLAHHINFGILEDDCCRLAFLRGVFLAGGSVTDPLKDYHLELVTSHLSVSRELVALMAEVEFYPKEIQRKANYVVYFKKSGYIEDFLTAIGAPLSAMEMMNAKVEKTLRGSVNRRVNCDAANLDKAVEAAQLQISCIHRLEELGLLESQNDKLRETARLRVAHPAHTLSQLAEEHNPPLTKSALNHRLRKLLELDKTQKTGEPR